MNDSVAARVLAGLQGRGETLATAESLTGGLIGSLLTAVPGASAVYRGGLITYATDLKRTLAGVAAQTLSRWGPVAAETAAEMAAGVAARCGADWGLAVTGVAGPDGQDGHRVGQVFVGVAHPGSGLRRVEELSLSGGRFEIRRQAAEEALVLLERGFGMQPADVVDR
ncbi:MAG TPA: CinA family protein [Propionibacteriaceae bacterium]